MNLINKLIREELHNHPKKVKINGFDYYYHSKERKLCLDVNGLKCTSYDKLTKNEKDQIYDQTNFKNPIIKYH